MVSRSRLLSLLLLPLIWILVRSARTWFSARRTPAPSGSSEHGREASIAAIGATTSDAEIVGELVAGELEEERATKASLQDRGMSVVSSSGVLLSLLTGIAAFAGRDSVALSKLPPWAVVLLVGAFALFVGAAALGLRVNRTRAYDAASVKELTRLVEGAWDPDLLRKRIAEMRVTVLTSARVHNRTMARELTWAIRLEVLAVAAGAVGLTLAFWG